MEEYDNEDWVILTTVVGKPILEMRTLEKLLRDYFCH